MQPVSSSSDHRKFLFSLLYGQLLSFLVALSALETKVLMDKYAVSTPALQNAVGYGLVCIIFVLLQIFYFKSFKLYETRYTIPALFVVAIFDSQASFFDVLAYRFSVSIASVGMLSSFTIPCVMLLSYIFLKVRYLPSHFFGTFIALLGLVFVVIADVLTSKDDGNSIDNASSNTSSTAYSDAVVGDFLIIIGSAFYATSNVASEAFVKSGSLIIFLVWMGFFASLISLIQFLFMELPRFSELVQSNSNQVPLLFILYGFTFVSIYFGAAKYLANFDSVVLNLSLLTTDVWGIVFGYFFFQEDIHLLKILGFISIVIGVCLYNMHEPIRRGNEMKRIQVSDDIQEAGDSSTAPILQMEGVEISDGR